MANKITQTYEIGDGYDVGGYRWICPICKNKNNFEPELIEGEAYLCEYCEEYSISTITLGF